MKLLPLILLLLAVLCFAVSFAQEEPTTGPEPTEEPTHSEETHGEDQEERIGYNESSAVVLIATFIVVISILFEILKHFVIKTANESMRPIVDGLFKELTVLGFVALIVFLISQGKALESISHIIFHEDEELTHLVELIHFLLFGMMLVYIVQVVVLVRLAMRSEHTWKKSERHIRSEKKMAEFRDIVQKREHEPGTLRRLFASHPKSFVFTPAQRQFEVARNTLHYYYMRRDFIKNYNSTTVSELGHNFDFSGYLTICLTEVLETVVEIPVATWIIVELFNVLLWGLLLTNDYVWISVAVVYPYFLLIILSIVVSKLKAVRSQLVIQSLFGDDDGEIPRYRTNKLQSRSKFGKLMFGAPGNLHEQLFWFDKRGPAFLMGLIRTILLLGSIHLCIFTGFITRVVYAHYGPGLMVVLIVLTYFPGVYSMTFILAPTMSRFALCTSIEMLQKPELVAKAVQMGSVKKMLGMLRLIHTLKTLFTNIRVARHSTVAVAIHDGSNSIEMEEAGRVLEQPSEEFKAEMMNIFKMFDTDKSGFISEQEFQALMTTLGNRETPEEMAHILKIIDKDASGTISFDEFCMFAFEMAKRNEGKVDKRPIDEFIDLAFNMFDTEKKGHVGNKKFTTILMEMLGDLSSEDADAIANEMDADNSGKITRKEFAKVVKKYDREFKNGTSRNRDEEDE